MPTKLLQDWVPEGGQLCSGPESPPVIVPHTHLPSHFLGRGSLPVESASAAFPHAEPNQCGKEKGDSWSPLGHCPQGDKAGREGAKSLGTEMEGGKKNVCWRTLLSPIWGPRRRTTRMRGWTGGASLLQKPMCKGWSPGRCGHACTVEEALQAQGSCLQGQPSARSADCSSRTLEPSPRAPKGPTRVSGHLLEIPFSLFHTNPLAYQF